MRLKAENLNRRLRLQRENYEVPHVSEYLEARTKYKRLQQDIHTWERKLRIAQVHVVSSQPIREVQPCFLVSPTWAGSPETEASSLLFGSDDFEDER